MCIVQRRTQLLHQWFEKVPGQHPIRLFKAQGRESRPIDVLHGDESQASGFLMQVVDTDDVGMREPVTAGSLPSEVIQRDRVGSNFRWQKFECDRLAQPFILRQPHLPHAAPAQRLHEGKAVPPDSLAKGQGFGPKVVPGPHKSRCSVAFVPTGGCAFGSPCK